jgi:hypothetical protein
MERYSEYCDFVGLDKVVTFSGGEPGLWYPLEYACEFGKWLGLTVKVCTNGLAFSYGAQRFVDRWHVHIFSSQFYLPGFATPENTILQYVVTKESSTSEIERIISESDGFSIKFFLDYFSRDRSRLEEKLSGACRKFGNTRLYARYTGVQTNRGRACLGCSRDCVTLKGVWLFPSGELSTCPQRRNSTEISLGKSDEVDVGFFERCREGHRIDGS